jgi:predicted Ser/Thr protein kinase
MDEERKHDEFPCALEDYEVEGLLGEGGEGRVFKATRRADFFPVAIKVVTRKSESATTSLEREASILRSIDNSGVARFYEFICIDNHDILILEYLQGPSLQVLLDRPESREGFPAEWVRTLVRSLAGTLADLAEKGVVHGDLTPGNLLCTERGTWKLIDFSLSVKVGERISPVGGMIVGSPAYMSPEQVQGQSLTSASDVYSLGCILYHLLHGRPPHTGQSEVEICLKHVSTELAPRQTTDNLFGRLDALASRCLAKEPTSRPTAQSIVEELSSTEIIPIQQVFALERAESFAQSRNVPSTHVKATTLANAQVAFLAFGIGSLCLGLITFLVSGGGVRAVEVAASEAVESNVLPARMDIRTTVVEDRANVYTGRIVGSDRPRSIDFSPRDGGISSAENIAGSVTLEATGIFPAERWRVRAVQLPTIITEHSPGSELLRTEFPNVLPEALILSVTARYQEVNTPSFDEIYWRGSPSRDRIFEAISAAKVNVGDAEDRLAQRLAIWLGDVIAASEEGRALSPSQIQFRHARVSPQDGSITLTMEVDAAAENVMLTAIALSGHQTYVTTYREKQPRTSVSLAGITSTTPYQPHRRDREERTLVLFPSGSALGDPLENYSLHEGTRIDTIFVAGFRTVVREESMTLTPRFKTFHSMEATNK